MSEQEPPSASAPNSEPREGKPSNRPPMRMIAPMLVVLVIAGGLIALLAGGSSKKSHPASSTLAATSYEGASVTPAAPAPALDTLRDYQGRAVNLASYRGKAVLVTFLYTHCPDVCPLIASQLHNTLSQLGARASDVQLIAVSVDPRGDTPGAVASFLRKHGLLGQMEYLTGSAHELAPVWSAWHVGSERDVGNPELVNHSAIIYGISARGNVTTVYDASFTPGEIIHDLPGLLSS